MVTISSTSTIIALVKNTAYGSIYLLSVTFPTTGASLPIVSAPMRVTRTDISPSLAANSAFDAIVLASSDFYLGGSMVSAPCAPTPTSGSYAGGYVFTTLTVDACCTIT